MISTFLNSDLVYHRAFVVVDLTSPYLVSPRHDHSAHVRKVSSIQCGAAVSTTVIVIAFIMLHVIEASCGVRCGIRRKSALFPTAMNEEGTAKSSFL